MPITVSLPAWRGPALDAVQYINAALAPGDVTTSVTQEQLKLAKLRIEQSLAQIDEDTMNGE